MTFSEITESMPKLNKIKDMLDSHDSEMQLLGMRLFVEMTNDSIESRIYKGMSVKTRISYLSLKISSMAFSLGQMTAVDLLTQKAIQ